MASLAARRGGRMSGTVWPGFVDLLTALRAELRTLTNLIDMRTREPS